MALRVLLVALLGIACVSVSVSARPRSYGYPLAAKYQTVKFNDGFNNLWGPQHESVSQDRSEITIWLDRSSGSGFKSLRSYRSGYFGAAIKLQAGYTAGVNTAFYLSNNQAYPGHHDEIDMEFLGTIPGRPYTLQTNIYINTRDGQTVTGREQQIHLWFDPTADFHHYGILWAQHEITFFVDNTPIRKYPRVDPATFPSREMWVYGSIWDASAWATDDGRYKADYKYEPFVAKFKDFILSDY